MSFMQMGLLLGLLAATATARMDSLHLGLLAAAAAARMDSCEEGAYQTKNETSWGACAGWAPCEAGHYCHDGAKHSCPAGTYGASLRETSSQCSGLCAPGYYCPAGSTTEYAHACGPGTFCPRGSEAPTEVRPGFYAGAASQLNAGGPGTPMTTEHQCPAGSYCVAGMRKECGAGTYGAEPGLASATCSGLCAAGYFCPAGSTAATETTCGGPEFICPVGSVSPTPTRSGHVAVARGAGARAGFAKEILGVEGGWASKGVQHYCPAGKFGNTSGVQALNETACCDCYPGYRCPDAGHTTNTQRSCGASDVFCPEGTAVPNQIRRGYYGVFTKNLVGTETYVRRVGLEAHTVSGRGAAQTRNYSYAEAPCPPGTYCKAGRAYDCPAGRFGRREASADPTCDGPCAAGRYCPDERRTEPYGFDCGAVDLICPLGSSQPQAARGEGWYTVGGDGDATRTHELRCEPGGWCVNGRRFLCTRGSYGDAYSLSNPSQCKNATPGYYIPSDGAVRGDAVPCGAHTLYCPDHGMTKPFKVQPGYFSVGGNDGLTRTGVRIAPPGTYAEDARPFRCPAGRYGARKGNINTQCDGACQAGFYCDAGSTRPTMNACGGPEYICPRRGLMNPMRISEGYYTLTALNPSDDGAFSDPCPPGRWRNASETRDFTLRTPSKHDGVSRASYPACQLCPPNTYKQLNGDALNLCRPCHNETMADEADRIACACLREPGGRELEDDEVLVFNFSRASNKAVCSAVNHSKLDEVLAQFNRLFNGTQFTKRSQKACEPGHWCSHGVRRPCAPGRYGDARRETRPDCAGPCAPGFYCPEASTSETQLRCGADRYCPAGSGVPRPFGRGAYAVEVEVGVPADVYTRQAPCPAGSYCVDAVRHPCAAGRFGSKTHANYTTYQCEGPCERGYLCPLGSSSAQQAPCGHPAVVCPTGSYEPTRVPDGYYSVHTGADADERLYHDPAGAHMDAFLPCEPGYYCRGGIKYACPAFRYGWRYMQVDAACDGSVAPGCYAPQPQDGPLLSDCPAQCGDINVYCPPTGQERRPTLVSPGHYAVGGTNTTRTGQEPCPPGTFCANGVVTNCPAGRYEPLAGQVRCDHACPPGFYCPEGSSEPLACSVGTFSLGLVDECTPCPYVDAAAGTQTCFDDRYCCPEFNG